MKYQEKIFFTRQYISSTKNAQGLNYMFRQILE